MLDGKIILVDDNEAVLKTLKMILAREFKTLVGVSVPTLLPALLREGDVDIVRQHLVRQIRALRILVVLMASGQRRVNVKNGQELLRHAGILGGNKIRRAKCSRHPRRHIVQVANGRGNNIQNSGHGVLLLSFTAPNVSNAPRGFASVFIIGIFAPGCKTAEKFKIFSSTH